MSMIWCQPAEQARLRLQMPQDLLCVQIAGNLGPRLGRPTVVGPRNIFPLTTHRLEQVCEHRLVHIGNAAQSLHPVAGQGFNLGIRDCACLVESLIDLSRLHPTPDSTRDSLAQARAGRALEPEQALAWDPIEALAHYRRRRQLDRRLLPALTSALPSLFASNLVPVAAARSVGLIALDAIPALRRAFTRLLMFGPG
jgi:2-octaprenyl-6-methoxyphenol hydroxylase